MDDIELAFDEFEAEVGADMISTAEYATWLKEVIAVAKERLYSAEEDLLFGVDNGDD